MQYLVRKLHVGRPPLQGDLLAGAFPGLKPWAVLLSHFMANRFADLVTWRIRNKLNYSLHL
ncbi:MAG: hypothetical protein JOZ31_22800 [Verrucomicrobia bacterium]|nr:hypothetical protein [Verrucomicrobiota bacterium]MBV8486418.1 hypothetical protein [Verrucomicrobiota bacterium]